mgnify:CR=1 FL=1
MQEEGGFEQVTIQQRWNYIANERLNLPILANKPYGNIVKGHYEKYIYPYNLFEAGVTTDMETGKASKATTPVKVKVKEPPPSDDMPKKVR